MAVGIAALALALAAGTAAAQATIQIGDPNDSPRRSITFAMPPPQVRGAPLSPEMNGRLARARGQRISGNTEAARDTLVKLLAIQPHHPTILFELAQVHKARGDWKALEQLARTERAVKKDSLLLAPEYALALDRLGRVKDATQVVLEARVADPTADWTIGELNRLVSASPREAASALKPVVAAYPGDVGLVRVAATLEWRSGNPRAALQMLAAADRNRTGTPQRWSFAEDMLRGTTGSDSASAAEVFLDLAADSSVEVAYRLSAARRAWAILRWNPSSPAASRVARALQDVPPEQWGDQLVLDITRGLREAGLTADARALAERAGSGGSTNPDLAVEKALNDLRENPDARALQGLAAVADRSPEAGFRYAEALFFAGQIDSAAAWYRRASTDPSSKVTGAALERLFLIEDGEPRDALPGVGRLAYEEWRGDRRRTAALAESLMAVLPRASLWAHVALTLATQREQLGDGRAALAPLMAVADSLPADRLAPLARQRAGDVLRVWYKDDARALDQYEECLARYPRAWNAPEVRRRVESMRRERRF
jgi:tetratricopeptide (TPR) repeat protein